MQTTANYGFNIVEGSDIVNPLTQLNPNFAALDTDLKAVSDKTYDKATCVKSGTNHAIVRVDTDKNLIVFTATGNWETGDTMTVDGIPVSVYLPDGTAPLTGAFVINTEVIAVLSGSRVTLYAAQELPGYTASDISYDNTGSGLTVSDVQDAIDEIVATINSKVVISDTPIVKCVAFPTGIVVLNINNVADLVTSDGGILTIPAGYRPSRTLSIPCTYVKNNIVYNGSLNVLATGLVFVSDASDNVVGNINHICASLTYSI